MPEVTADTFNLKDKQPAELEQRRREIVSRIAAMPKGYDDPDVPIELLQELSLVAAMLRHKTSGPPKTAKTSKRGSGPKMTADDLANILG